MLQLLQLIQLRGVYLSHPESMERQVNEGRVKTFIELTRQALEEDRIGQPDLSYHPKLALNHKRSDRTKEGKGSRRKG